MGERGKAGLCSGVAKPWTIYYTDELKRIISTDRRKRSRADRKVLQQKKGGRCPSPDGEYRVQSRYLRH